MSTSDTAAPMFAEPTIESTMGRRISLILAGITAAALIANCLLTSPPRFSQQQREDISLLRPVVNALALGGAFPTARGVEIRNLCFYVGAALLTLLAGFRLVSARIQPSMAADDLFDLRSRAAGPLFWWGVMLMVSVVTSAFAHAPDVCKGQVIIHFLFFAWWWPLALLLAPRHVRALSAVLIGAMAATAAVGIWYFSARTEPGWVSALASMSLPKLRLKYPIGNELWFGACLLPAIFIGLGLLAGHSRSGATSKHGDGDEAKPTPTKRSRCLPALLAVIVALVVIGVALFLTRSRSAAVGLAAGCVGLAFLAIPRKGRPGVVLVGLLLAIAGAWYVQHLRVAGVMGQRAHSVRARLNYEWPYALTLFFRKPIGGYGDGCYAMLAGQLARDDQLKDPSVIAVEEDWTVHAHNEWLELLADIGLVGAVSFLLAIVMTLFVAVRFCDRLRGDSAHHAERWLAMGLAAALIGMAFEEGSDVAIRQPGFAPIFLTVWGVLWALVRSARPVAEPEHDAPRLGLAIVKLTGGVAMIAAVVLAYYGVQDWRAARARFETESRLKAGRFAEAIAWADFAGNYALDPFQKLSARMLAVRARSGAFAQRLAASDAAPSDETMDLAREARIRLHRLNLAAPRFLGVSRLAWELSLNTATAYHRRDDDQTAAEFHDNYVRWLEQNRADEPFRIGLVQRLWREKPGASPIERLTWLRCLIRRGPMDSRFLQLVRSFGRVPGAAVVMNDLLSVALQDHGRPVSQWSDQLSPETLRIAALADDWSGHPPEAVKLARQADEMYARAGGRLFAAHAAAVQELVRYEFHVDPIADTDQRLKELARAQTLLAGPTDPSAPLPDGLGQTRLRILLAAGQEREAKAQLEAMNPTDHSPMSEQLARAYVSLAEVFAYLGRHVDLASQWARRAAQLAPDLADASDVQTRLCLQQGDDKAALVAARRFIETSPKRKQAFALLQQAEARWPGSSIWADLRRQYPDYPPSPNSNRPPPTTTSQASDHSGDS